MTKDDNREYTRDTPKGGKNSYTKGRGSSQFLRDFYP